VDGSVAALAEHGPGFSIGASHGAVSIPAEGSDTAAVLQLADQRLYARKEQRRPPEWPAVPAVVADQRFSRR
jgi:GGDEF domain-containing protein